MATGAGFGRLHRGTAADAVAANHALLPKPNADHTSCVDTTSVTDSAFDVSLPTDGHEQSIELIPAEQPSAQPSSTDWTKTTSSLFTKLQRVSVVALRQLEDQVHETKAKLKPVLDTADAAVFDEHRIEMHARSREIYTALQGLVRRFCQIAGGSAKCTAPSVDLLVREQLGGALAEWLRLGFRERRLGLLNLSTKTSRHFFIEVIDEALADSDALPSELGDLAAECKEIIGTVDSSESCESSFAVLVCHALNKGNLSNLIAYVASDSALLAKHFDRLAPIRDAVVSEAFCAILEPLEVLEFSLATDME